MGYPNLSELSQVKKGHFVWRVDRFTGTGLISASRIARLEIGDMPLNAAFEKCGMTPHQAKIHSKKVVDFVLLCNCGKKAKEPFIPFCSYEHQKAAFDKKYQRIKKHFDRI